LQRPFFIAGARQGVPSVLRAAAPDRREIARRIAVPQPATPHGYLRQECVAIEKGGAG